MTSEDKQTYIKYRIERAYEKQKNYALPESWAREDSWPPEKRVAGMRGATEFSQMSKTS